MNRTLVRKRVLHTLGDGSPREREPEVVQAVEQSQNDRNEKVRRKARKVLTSYRYSGRVNVL